MLATLSPPIPQRMNHTHALANSITVHWFADTDRNLDRVSSLASDSIQWDYQNKFQKSSAIQVSITAPCQVVIIEIPSIDVTSVDTDNHLDYVTSLIEQVIRHGTYPTIICLGDKLPAERFIQWMQLGIFSYAEASSDASTILDLIHDAKKHASEVLSKYLLFRKLQKTWGSLDSDELIVVELVFEGLPNKTIASRLKLSQRTIEARRHRIFEKFESKSLSIVVRRICEWHQLKREFRDEI